jgi:hypothetical protein
LKAAFVLAMLSMGATLPACGAPSATKSEIRPDVVRVREDPGEDILEAVFRYQFDHEHCSGRRKEDRPVPFLSIRRQDPSPSFMARFAEDRPPVKPGSEFVEGKGILFSANEIRHVDVTRVEVDVECYAGPEGGAGNTYILVTRDGRWFVIEELPGWIS